MAHYSRHSMASAAALAVALLSLSGCGGSTGTEFVSTLPPPPPPPSGGPPPPPPPAPAGVVTAAAGATLPSASDFPDATDGGPTMQAHDMTTFPLIETVVTLQFGSAGADAAANTGGATFSFNAPQIQSDTFALAVPGAGLDVAMSAGGFYCYSILCGYASGRYVEMTYQPSTTNELSWTNYGFWGTYSLYPTNSFSTFVTGYKTPVGSIPTTGSATYSGKTVGFVYYPVEGGAWETGIGLAHISGDASLDANFGTGAITGGLTNMTAGGLPWNNVALAGTISSGVNSFSGTAAVTSAPGGITALNAAGTGSFVGMFFGPGAAELGAVWTLFDGIATATGSIGAKKTP